MSYQKLFLNIVDCAKLVVKQGRKAMGLKIARLPNTSQLSIIVLLFYLFIHKSYLI